MSLKDYLRETLDLGRDDLFKVDVKEGFSFFNTDSVHAEKVMEVLNSINHEGRKVNVEISTNEGGSGRSSGRRDHNNRGGGRSSGGFGSERRSSSRSFSGDREGGRERRSSDRNFAPRTSDKDRPVRNERSATRGDRPRRTRND